MASRRDAIRLTNSELMQLTRRANSRVNRAEDARRARLILLLGGGHTWDEVAEASTAAKRSQRARYRVEALFAELKQQIQLRRVRL